MWVLGEVRAVDTAIPNTLSASLRENAFNMDSAAPYAEAAVSSLSLKSLKEGWGPTLR